MLAPRQILFTAVEGVFDLTSRDSWDELAGNLDTLARRGIPLILCSRGTRAQLAPLRRKMEHNHPFITESGGGLFIPDGYFNVHLEGGTREGRNFCVPFAQPHAEAVTALAEIADEAGADVVGLSQLTAKEVARNIGLSPRDAEPFRKREFGELFFFAGETAKGTSQFSEIAKQKGWEAVPGEPFWELRGPLRSDGSGAVRYLMSIYRKMLHGKQRAIGIGGDAGDLYFLRAADVTFLLSPPEGEFDERVLAALPRAARSEQPGAAGFSEAVVHALEKP